MCQVMEFDDGLIVILWRFAATYVRAKHNFRISKRMQFLGTRTCCTPHLNLYVETNIYQSKYLKSIAIT